MMSHPPKTTRTLLALLIGAIGVPPIANAGQLALVQYPPGTASKQPAPNVIISLDDSGSMSSGRGSGMYALKEALQATFDATTQIIPDGSIRLAWNTMNACPTIPSNTGGCANVNHMRVLDATHRANFLNWVGQPTDNGANRLRANGNTPTHKVYVNAGDYMKNASVTDVGGPWANVPGTTLEPVLSCRRSYSLLMTDGEWNIDPTAAEARGLGDGNADGTDQTFPDGKPYSTIDPQTYIYRDTWGGGNRSTLADLAFHFWATDLSTLDNTLSPIVRQSGSQNFTVGANTKTLEEYWNPRNNPATWQNLVTYVIGFRSASTWSTSVANKYPIWGGDTYAGSYPNLVIGAGDRIWPNPTNAAAARKVEHWHMAINGRGRFIKADEAADLTDAFKDILGEIVADANTPITSFASSSSSVTLTAATQYRSGYEALGWKGYVMADTLARGTAAATPDPTWGLKQVAPPAAANITTADKLDALTNAQIANRLVLSYRDTDQGAGGTSFEWATDGTYLSTEQNALLAREGSTGAVTDEVAAQRLAFIRGDRSQEGSPFRTRVSRQGDIVNSKVWYIAQPAGGYAFDGYRQFVKTHRARLPMVYVGGNDGMLHGFSGVDGSEKIAYVPKGVIRNLPELTRTSYQHRYFVDGSPFSGDVNWGTSTEPDWRSLLIGTLGGGGKGYFVLDVTKPGTIATDGTGVASNFEKARAADLVVMDKTAHPTVVPVAGSAEADIGHIMVEPVLEDGNPQKTTQIVRMNNGRWALVMGNGYNSTNERPVLLVQYLDGTRELLRIPAATTGGNASTNGLSAPRLVDINGDGTPDVVYAGDLKGNLWKFDVSSATASNWAVAFSGLPLYSAAYVAGSVSTPQAITAAPVVRANPAVNGLMVAFGTGRNITEGDRTSTGVQTLYSVLDNTRYKLSGSRVVVDNSQVTSAVVGSGVTSLVQQTVGNTELTGSGSSSARRFWTVSQNTVAYTGANAKKGWYLNLPETGERVLDQMAFYDGGNNIELISEVPASGGSTATETCAPSPALQKTYRTLLNIIDGRKPGIQVMDLTGDGNYNAADQNVSRMTASSTENKLSNPKTEIRVGAGAGTTSVIDNLNKEETPLRPNWRQLQ